VNMSDALKSGEPVPFLVDRDFYFICHQCGKKVKHLVYHANGMICEECKKKLDVVELEERKMIEVEGSLSRIRDFDRNRDCEKGFNRVQINGITISLECEGPEKKEFFDNLEPGQRIRLVVEKL